MTTLKIMGCPAPDHCHRTPRCEDGCEDVAPVITWSNLRPALRRMSPAEIKTQARLMYISEERFPLPRWVDEVRAGLILVDSVTVIQMIHAYTNLWRNEGDRAADLE